MLKQKLSSKLAVVGLVILFIFLGQIKFRQWQEDKSIQKQVQSLKDQQWEREQKRAELEQTLGYLNSNDFKEKVARKELGFKRSGEVVYGFSETQNEQITESASIKTTETNAQKWWKYFFN